MRLLVIAAGRVKPGPLADLWEGYCARLSRPLELREVEARGAGPEREARLILAALPEGGLVWALDERGLLPSSRDFARWLDEAELGGTRHLALVIGGADGLDASVRARADRLISFGRLTWPHLLVRVLLAEQLWRAESISAGHPYHRD